VSRLWSCRIALLFATCALALLWSVAAQAEPVVKSGYALSDETCGPFPKVATGMRAGYCAGLVASREDGLVFPRNIVQIPDTDLFVVADIGGWDARRGRLLLLDPAASAGQRIKVLLRNLDVPHGLGIGADRRVYASTAEKIFRFDPRAPQPEASVEVIVQGLPGLQPTLSDGTKLDRNFHPLKPFVFDSSGTLYVNIGAPNDACARGPQTKACAAGEGASALAAIWAFRPPAGGIFPALMPGDPSPPHEVYARGLRNSMALAVHPQFPAEGFAFLQAENARDLPDPFRPNEEINAIEKGKHYGWPYCYDLTTGSPEYAGFLKQSGPYRELCANAGGYRKPHSLLPPHAAPLGMGYYGGKKFPELEGKLLIALHGYRPTGSRVIFYDVDAKGFPKIEPPPVRYRVSCAGEPTQVLRTEPEGEVAAAPFRELIADWHKVHGVRPQGTPVGMTIAADGAIWLVEDKNKTILRIDAEPASTAAPPLSCDQRSEAQLKTLQDFVANDSANRERLTRIRTDLVEKHCLGCHSDFDLQSGQTAAQKDVALLRFLLTQDGWLYPGDPEAGRLHQRVWGKGAEKVMPPNGRELLASDPSYRQLLVTLDQFVSRMVPGERRRTRLGNAVAQRIENGSGKVCGSLPNRTLVVVVDGGGKPGFSRIFRPADQYLNGECHDEDGYYIATRSLDRL
jgi:glucose/arabinose dehydrogenase